MPHILIITTTKLQDNRPRGYKGGLKMNRKAGNHLVITKVEFRPGADWADRLARVYRLLLSHTRAAEKLDDASIDERGKDENE